MGGQPGPNMTPSGYLIFTSPHLKYNIDTNFRIEDESEGYRLHIGKYSGNAGDSLADEQKFNVNGTKFTTFDRDNDNSYNNCAESWKGAWWFTA